MRDALAEARMASLAPTQFQQNDPNAFDEDLTR